MKHHERRRWSGSSTRTGSTTEPRAWLTKLRDQRATYTDAVSFAVMNALRCRLVLTFDHDFLAASFTPWQA